jgi:hypothetical protein
MFKKTYQPVLKPGAATVINHDQYLYQMKRLLIFLLFISPTLFAQQASMDTIWLSNTAIPLQKTLYGSGSEVVFINVHANETTSVAAAGEYLKDKSGLLVALMHDTTRLITFYHTNRLIQFDPNRIFSKRGRLANLKLLNRNLPVSAEKLLARFAGSLTETFQHAKIIIAMHNNTDGKPLSVKSFKQVYINPEMDSDDFILTTEKTIFNELKKKRINAVLQTQKTSIDDGSLSIYCDKKKIPYVNIEAQQGHIDEQVMMLNALTSIIEKYTPSGL